MYALHPLMQLAMNLMIVPGMLVCSSILISLCMFTVSKALLISSATGIVCAGGGIWLHPFATVLFNVCSAVTVEFCVLHTCCVGVFGMSSVMKGRRLFSNFFAITESGDMGLYEVPFAIPLLEFVMGTMLANFHVCGIMLLLRAVLNMLVRNSSPRGPMCFRYLKSSVPGSCELLFLHYFIASWS